MSSIDEYEIPVRQKEDFDETESSWFLLDILLKSISIETHYI